MMDNDGAYRHAMGVLRDRLKVQMKADTDIGIYEHVDAFIDEVRQEMNNVIAWAEDGEQALEEPSPPAS